MLTKIKICKKSADANFKICSKNTFFTKVYVHFSKLDIYKCPFLVLHLDF